MSGPEAVALKNASFCYLDESGLSSEVSADSKVSAGRRESTESCVQEICLSVLAGSCTILCGRSGNGKTTVLRLIDGLAGTFFPGEKGGAVLVRGTDVFDLSPRDRTESIGVVMQDPRSQFFMGTVGDEIAFSLENMGTDPSLTVKRVREAASLCGIEDLLDERLTELSSGQKQRVALAAATACHPQVLVLDEPTSNLDAQGSRSLVKILGELRRSGVAMVISEHRLHQFLPVANEFVYLREGRIAARWSAERFASLSERETAKFGLRHPDMKSDSKIKPYSAKDSDGWRMVDVTYRYPPTKRGIDGITAEFPFGSVTVICGENGTGKTTLAKVLVGAVREQGGIVTRNGKRLSRKERRLLSYFVMQDVDYQLYASCVADEVVLGRHVDDSLKARARDSLAAFDLTDLATRHPASLSGGQKQRVILAAAYCSDAELIVLDEPTSGLDGRGMREVACWCRKLASGGRAVVVITHDELLAQLAGNRIVDLSSQKRG